MKISISFRLLLQDVLIKVGLSVHFQLSNNVTPDIGGHVGMCLFVSAPSHTPCPSNQHTGHRMRGKTVMKTVINEPQSTIN